MDVSQLVVKTRKTQLRRLCCRSLRRGYRDWEDREREKYGVKEKNKKALVAAAGA